MNQEQGSGDGIFFVHKTCGFPIWQDEDGNWQHVSAADGAFCDLLFSGGSMLDKLMEED